MINEMKTLVAKLNKAIVSYYNTGQPIMSDKEYDALYDKLVSLEKETNIIMSNSPTQLVGCTVLDGLKKSKHKYTAKSLDKTKDREQIAKFLDDKQGLISFKLDGLTTVLTYEDGKLVSAVTRGNGEVGDDITENVKHFKNVPLAIPYKDTLILRGESVISYDTFEKINSNNEYKNPRNLVSGTIRNLDSSIVADRGVEWVCFEVVEGFDYIYNKSEKLFEADKNGFDTVKRYTIEHSKEVSTIISVFENALNSYQYPTDGLVATFNDIKYSSLLGETSHHPLDSLVLKWKDEVYETTLTDIEWQVGRTGVVTPVAIFEEVDLDGALTTRASLHNLDIMDGLNLGIGDTITVYRANMVIPQIDENLTQSNTYQYPTQCPECNHALTIKSTPARFLQCTNENCKAKIVGKLSHFVSRDAMNIEGLSEETIRKIMSINVMDSSVLLSVFDIFNLAQHKDKLYKLDGMGKKSVDRLLQSIEKAKVCKLENFIFGLGIDNVGKSTAKLLAKTFGDYDTLQDATVLGIKCIDGIGDIVANSIYSYFHSSESDHADLLVDYVLKFEEANIPRSNKLEGLTFVITGSVEHFANRKDLQSTIENLGGKVSGSVSTKTNYLINNYTSNATGKNKKAIDIGVKIISEGMFLDMIKEERPHDILF